MSADRTGPELPGVRRHLLFGWWSLLCFLSLGIGLESLWGFRVGWYVDEVHSMRRLLWTLGHAHGALFALIHIAFALTVRSLPDLQPRTRAASPCLIAASILMPSGFFLGGIFMYGGGGDPGIAIWLVPVGATCLFVAVFLTAAALSSHFSSSRKL